MKVLISLILSGLMGLISTVEAQDNGQLVVFVQEGRSISQDFKRHALPEVKKIAKQNGLQLRVVDASNGAPKEVTYTPSIFMVKGNSNVLYNGRYNKFYDLTAFVQSGGENNQPQLKIRTLSLEYRKGCNKNRTMPWIKLFAGKRQGRKNLTLINRSS
ncbi:MAG: hypothetical protein R2788_00905 [Saprospiraceae bacterium]